MRPLNLSSSSESHTPFGERSFWGAVVLGTVLSLLFSGYAFPESNNVYHLPIIGELYDDPAFADDPYVQSLRYFSSGLWMALAGSDRWIDPGVLFFVGLVLSRALAFFGILLCADHLGVSESRTRCLFAGLIASIALMQNASLGGVGSLFISSFTHSEIPNGLFYIAVWGVMTGRFTLATCMLGPMFFLNGFFAVWVSLPLALVFLGELISRRSRIRTLLMPLGAGALVGAICAAPVLVNAFSNPDMGAPSGFDYKSYLRFYYPYHFLFESISVKLRIGIALVLIISILALRKLHDPQRRLAMLLFGIVCLYGLGVVLSYTTDSRLILNLHLLRSGVLLHLMASLFVCVVAARGFFSARDGYRVVLASGIIAVAAFDVRASCVLLAGLFLADAVAGETVKARIAAFVLPGERLVRSLALGILVIIYSATAWKINVRIAHEATWRSEWAEVATWAKNHTAEKSTFLAPVFFRTKSYPDQQESVFGAGSNVAFEYLSHRSLWADFKRGACVMWAPSTYPRWRSRVEEVERLQTLDEKMEYAVTHGIPYVIAISYTGCAPDRVFQTDRLCVYATGVR